MASGWIHNFFNSRQEEGAFSPVLLLVIFFIVFQFLGSSGSWAACVDSPHSICSVYTPGPLCKEWNITGGVYCPSSDNCHAGCVYNSGAIRCQYKCGGKCQADSLACVSGNNAWDSENCRCEDNSGCDSYRAQCEQADGVFTGTASSGCCKAMCNQCKALSKQIQLKSQLCCDRGLAPPDSVRQCRVEARNTCGMNWSTLLSNDNEFKCRDPSLSESASAAYTGVCFGPTSSSAGAGSSSGGGGSSSGAGDCPECPYLQDILDTLTKQKQVVGDIYSCVSNWELCNEAQEDTSLMPKLRPYLDSVMVIGDKEITILGRIDTSLFKLDTGFRKFVDIGTEGLQNDTLTRAVIVEGNLKVLDSLGKIRSSISGIPGAVDVLNDSTRNYFDKLAATLGISVDSLLSHLDSIKKNIPSDILDSIAKYERLNYEKEFIIDDIPLIDSLIDSTVTYFRLVHKYDSIRHVLLSDSLGSIHDAINGVAYGIGERLGYGDTASSTLRKDVNAIGDTLSKYLKGVGVDTGGVSYGSGFVASGQRMGDSIKDAVGWGYVDTLNIDSLYARALNGYKTDSISQDVQDSLNQLGMRLNDSLIAKTDSIKNALPAYLDSMADSLVLWAPFADFDSIIYSSIGAHIPNRSDCPEDCQKWTVSIPIIGLHSYEVDFGLCLGRASFAGLSVLGFLKLLIRIIVAYTCIMTIGRVLVRMI